MPPSGGMRDLCPTCASKFITERTKNFPGFSELAKYFGRPPAKAGEGDATPDWVKDMLAEEEQ